MKTKLSTTKLLCSSKLKLFFLILISIGINTANAALNTYGLTTGSASLDPMSSGTTTLISTNVNNGVVSAVTSIGFTFTLNGTSYTQFSVNENGLMRLGATVISNASTNSLASSLDLPKIAPYWDDLKTVAGTVRSRLIGIAPSRTLVVDWNVTIVNTSAAIQFQVWLFEGTNKIQFVYGGGTASNPGAYSIGLATSTTDFTSITVASPIASSTASTVTANNANTAAIASTSSFIYMPAPPCPVITSPTAGAASVAINAQLNWTAGLNGTTSVYDVYFGTAANPPLVASNQAGTTYNPGALTNNTGYFWKIVGKNGSITVAQSASCAINQFTTAALPSCAINYSPAHLATNVPIEPTLSWTASASPPTPTGYDVYFGTASNPPLVSSNQAGATYNPPGFLNFNTIYYWKVVPHNGTDVASGCTINQFTTKGKLAYEITRSTNIAYTSISGTGSSVPQASWRQGNNTDDNLSNSLPIGFNFTYNGSTYSNFLVSTNGFITFNVTTTAQGQYTTSYGYPNSNLSTGSPGFVSPLTLAPFWDDITCQGGGSNLFSNLDNCIKYQTSGSVGSRILTVEWRGMETYATAGPDLNFQVKLYEGTNNIDFIYGPMEAFNGTASQVFSYSSGINASSVSSTPQDGEVINQQIANTRSFALASSSQLHSVAECNTRIRFTPGTYTAYVPVSLVPPNDSMGAPIHLAVNGSPCIDICGTVYKSALATFSKAATCGGTPDDDVWFDFIATNANTTIKVLGSGGYDPILELFNSSMTSLVCANTPGNGIGLSETINSTTLVVGQKYIIRVYEKSVGAGPSGSGEFSICVSGTPVAPPNDNCIAAISLPISATLTTGSNTYAATLSPNIPSCGLPNGENPDDDVWYKFTAIKPIEVITVVGGNGFNAVIQLLAGNCNGFASLACVNNYANGQTETLTASGLTVGNVYYVRVFHAGLGGGSGNFQISVSSPPPPCTDLVLPPNNEPYMSASGIDLIWDPVVGADNYKILFDTVNPPTHLLATTTDTTVNTGILTQTKTYFWKIIPGNGNSYNNSCEIDSFHTEETPLALTVRVFLQNLYLTNQTMKTVLNPADTIADTVTITLYDELGEFQYAGIALLSTNGWATGYFPLLAVDSPYYFAVSHRNSLEVWSTTLFNLTENDTTFDFAHSPSQIYGNNVVQVQTGVYAMICGDINQDGFIDSADVNRVGQGAANFEIGYYADDFNADGYVESLDLSQLENKVPLLLKKRTPFPPYGP